MLFPHSAFLRQFPLCSFLLSCNQKGIGAHPERRYHSELVFHIGDGVAAPRQYSGVILFHIQFPQKADHMNGMEKAKLWEWALEDKEKQTTQRWW